MKNAYPLACAIVGGVLLLGATSAGAQDWPQWRGPNRDNKVSGFTEPKTWPKELTQKWKVTVGDGDASPALVGDKIYVFARQGGEEVTLCLDAGNGKEIWKDHYEAKPAQVPRGGHQGPRSTPAMAEGKVCTLGVTGVLSCLDAETGKVVWRKDSKAYPMFFTSSSPLIVDGKCIAFLGGDSSGNLGAFDLANGEEKWKWTAEGASYGSPVLLTVDGTKQIVTLTKRSLVGIGVADGKQLWQAPFSASYNSGTPVVDGQTVICSGPPGRMGGKGGTTAFQIEKKEDGFKAKELWTQAKSPAGIYNTPVLKDGLLFGLSSSNGMESPTNFYCMDAKTGDVLWSDSTKRGPCGTVLDAGSVLLALTSDSELFAIKPGNKEYTELAKIKVADSPTWAYPIIAGNRVFVKGRDSLILWTFE